MNHNEVPNTVVEVPANWWKMAAANPERNLLIIADSIAWVLSNQESLAFSISMIASLGGNPNRSTDEQIIGLSTQRIRAFTPLPHPQFDDDLIIVGNN